jgi:hypothetical protein
MKTKTTITEITHDDIVNLLSTGLYGSQFLGVDYSIEDYRKIPNPDEYDCIEDKCAKLLLNGKSIVIYDMYAEDEEDFHGKLYHSWDSDNATMDYTITLSDIKKGLQKALDNGGWDAKCAFDLINDDSCGLDLTEAENLLQIITFGEAIYG